jgi:hypothetical protein
MFDNPRSRVSRTSAADQPHRTTSAAPSTADRLAKYGGHEAKEDHLDLDLSGPYHRTKAPGSGPVPAAKGVHHSEDVLGILSGPGKRMKKSRNGAKAAGAESKDGAC